MHEIMGQVRGRAELLREAPIGAPHARQELLRRLHRALGPAKLLAAPRLQRVGHLTRDRQSAAVQHALAGELRAVAQIEVLREGVGLPSTGGVDRVPAPDPARAVEVEREPRPGPRRLLDREVTVDPDRLGACERGARGVQVLPAPLHEGRIGVGLERRCRAPHKVRGHDEVRVEERHERRRAAWVRRV